MGNTLGKVGRIKGLNGGGKKADKVQSRRIQRKRENKEWRRDW